MSETSTLTPVISGDMIQMSTIDLTDQFGVESLTPYWPGFRSTLEGTKLEDFDSWDREKQLRHIGQYCIESSQTFADQSLENLGIFIESGDETGQYDFHGFLSMYADNIFRSNFVNKICQSLGEKAVAVDLEVKEHAKAIFSEPSNKPAREAYVGPYRVRNDQVFVEDIPVLSSYKFVREW